MGKMMPGHVRHEGIALYDQKAVREVRQVEETIVAWVDGHEVQYRSEDEHVACGCDFFASKGFCKHVAALEHYFKNDVKGKSLFVKAQKELSETQVTRQQKSQGSQLLDRLLPAEKSDQTTYRLQAEGHYSLLDKDLLWTLKLVRQPDTKAYVVRDVRAFLRALDASYAYQMGKNYYEPLQFTQFDEASQKLILFLKRLLPDTLAFDSSFYLPHQGRYLRLSQGFFEEGLGLMQDLFFFKLEWQERSYQTLSYSVLEASSGLFDFRVQVEQESILLHIAERDYQVLFGGGVLFRQGCFYSLDQRQKALFKAFQDVPSVKDDKHLVIDFEDKDRLAALLVDLQKIGTVQAPKAFQIYGFEIFLDIRRLPNDRIQVEVQLECNGTRVRSQEDLDQLPFSLDYQQLQSLWQVLREQGFESQFHSTKELSGAQAIYRFYAQTLPALEALGTVTIAESLSELYSVSQGRFYLDSRGDWLEVQFAIDGLSSEEIDRAYETLQNQELYYVTPQGKLVIFDEASKRVNETLTALRAGLGKLSSLSAMQVARALEQETSVTWSEAFEALVQHLRHPESFLLGDLSLTAELRGYQRLGVQWLAMLYHYGLGGILADDMGLGKTLQTIAFLSHSLPKDKRALILAPSSLIYNWQEEFTRFAPQLSVSVSYGQKAERTSLLAQEPQILIMSYATFRQDSALLREQTFEILILDEAQAMKNDQTKIASLLRQFEVRTCFALSGTPVENRLQEIWSIFQIVLPDLLPNKRRFNQLSAIEVARLIKPFVLRRRKDEVLQELPDLIETVQMPELTDDQKVIYLAQLEQLRNRLATASDQEINRQKIEILSAITRLRQICNTPKLFLPEYGGDSGKLEALRELLLQIKENDHRVLIFSQFRGMLDMIEQEMALLGLSSYKITGSTRSDERQAITRAFNAGSRDAVLISLKAGGVGINLTGADTVILVDLWWNPAVEEQAISRAYRMGQERHVECFRLVTRGTIEEKIQALQERKRELFTSLLDGQEARSQLSVEDIREILSLPE